MAMKRKLSFVQRLGGRKPSDKYLPHFDNILELSVGDYYEVTVHKFKNDEDDPIKRVKCNRQAWNMMLPTLRKKLMALEGVKNRWDLSKDFETALARDEDTGELITEAVFIRCTENTFTKELAEAFANRAKNRKKRVSKKNSALAITQVAEDTEDEIDEDDLEEMDDEDLEDEEEEVPPPKPAKKPVKKPGKR